MPKLSLRHAFTALLLLLAMLVQGTWALAGTTGGLQGNVNDASTGAPIAGAKVSVVSASQTANSTTDGSGHYIFLSLLPDTYTVSVDKQGFESASQAGITIFADNTSSQSFRVKASLKTIAQITSRATSNLVKSGVTADTYNVNASTAAAASALGGGGNLQSAYSAMSSVPGTNVPVGGAGWNNNAVFIRGNQSFFTSFEYDGVPVNRAFDNYNSSTESSLGLQELQVYTGGGPPSISSAGISGFINQVIKTGTYPGFGSLNGGIGTPTFYHSAVVEAGGATPNRNFSYYVGVSGYNQDFRLFDNSNGAGLFNLGQQLDYFPQWTSTVGFGPSNSRGVWPVCGGTNGLTSPTAGTQPWLNNGSCFFDNVPAALYGNLANISDRENVVNLHFGIPHRDGQRDDIQLLWGASALNTSYYSSPNDAGGFKAYFESVTGTPYTPGAISPFTGLPGYPSYIDSLNTYNLAFGTPIFNTDGSLKPVGTYSQPSSPTNRSLFQQLPADRRDQIHNDTGIVKAQYTHAMGSNAYARLFGYSFFSDWTQAGANSTFNCYVNGIGGPNDCGIAANYDLITHTAGGEFQFADQISSQHLLQFTANYTTATVSRFNNTGWISNFINNFLGNGGGSLVGYISHNNGQYQCWNPATGDSVVCKPSGPYRNHAGLPASSYPSAPAGSPAALAGAQWVSLQNGNSYGTFNTVKPNFTFLSLTDDFRPSDKLDINIGLRYDNFLYHLAPLTPGTQFYAGIITNSVCQNGSGQILSTPLRPGQPPPAPVFYTTDCTHGPGGVPISGYHHPSFSATSPASYNLAALSPRFSFSYTLDPSTVIRGEVGRYTEPPISASLQYLNSTGNALTVWTATLPLGFNSPFHPIPLQSALQSDLSIEHQLHGTDISFKISPFYNYTQGYQQQSFIGPNFVTQVPVGAGRNYGVELAVNKGDFNRDGLSGSLAFTYTNAKVQYQSKYFGSNQIATADTAITQFNTLTKGGGGSPCYSPATASTPGAGESCSVAGAILNPYYNTPVQAVVDPNGWYSGYGTALSPTNNTTDAPYDAPIVASLILNYKHQRFAITPSFQISEGSSYGGPMDITGLDPRACGQNSLAAGILKVSPNTNPLQCNYLSLVTGNFSPSPVAGQLFIPNPTTGTFSIPGQFRNPWVALLNVQLRYDISPKITALATLADVWHTCFGGDSFPWTKAYGPGANVCNYGSNFSYTSNFFNGTSPMDGAANGLPAQKWIQQAYLPGLGSVGSGLPFPFNAYFQVQVKL